MSFFEKVCRCFELRKIPYAVVGGYAVALHGVVRGTVDVDLITGFSEENFIAVESAMNSLGLYARLPVTAKEVYQFRKEYIANRNLIAWSFVNPKNPLEMVDIIITDNLFDFATEDKQVSSLKIKVISKKDLIKMKKRSGRPQDLLDANALEKL